MLPILVLAASFFSLDCSDRDGREGVHEGPEKERSSTGKRASRVLILGIDGAAWTEIDRLIDGGELPHFARLKRDGVVADLISLQDFSKSVVIWNSIATGVTPDRHGIVDFVQWDDTLNAAVPTSSRIRRVPAFWEIVERWGLSVGVVGHWGTWPVEEMKRSRSFMLSDRFLSEREYRAYPDDLIGTIDVRAVLGGGRGPQELVALLTPFFDFEADRVRRDDHRYLESNLRTVSFLARDDAAKYVLGLESMDRFRSDVVFNYIRLVDVCQHFFWPSEDVARWAFPNSLPADRVIAAAYRWADQFVGAHLAAAGPRAAVLVISDHGGGPEKHPLYVTADERTGDLLGLSGVARVDPKWNYQLGVHILKQGRDPNGVVREQEFEPVRAELERKLLGLRTADGQVVLRRVPSSSEDLLFAWNRWALTPESEIVVGGERKLLGEMAAIHIRTGTHKREGIFAALGPPFRQGVKLASASVLDVLPTLAALLEIPVADDLDGTPLVEAFEPEFLEEHPIRSIASYGSRETLPRGEVPEAAQEVLEQLEALGYVQRAAKVRPDGPGD